MRRPGRMLAIRPAKPPKPERQPHAPSQRDYFAMMLGIVTAGCLIAAFIFSKGTNFLMPGPLATAHGAIENCNACHTKNGTGKLSWIHGIVAGDPLADSKACLTCHKMPDTAFNAHSASAEVLKQSTARLAKTAATTPAPQSARAQQIAFPTDDVVARPLYCATCHQEHQGPNFNLARISNEQCRSCHVVKFDSFDGHHPNFDNYPFERRTRIIFDHAGHFGKHYPEVAQKDPAKRVPTTCSTCHDSRQDKQVMAVAPFDQTCTTCHLDQIIGKERATGPKGIAFLSLPALDLETLKEKKAGIGEWPEDSIAPVTPFMKVLLAQDEDGRTLIKKIEKLDLQDLADASDQDIATVTKFVWRVKRLYYSLITEKASDVLAKLDLGGGVKVGKDLTVNLTAGIPREVIVGAQRAWLPNLGKEIANRKEAANNAPPRAKDGADQPPGNWSTAISESKLAASVAPEELGGTSAKPAPQDTGIRLAQAENVQRAPDQTDDLLYPNGGAPAPAGPPSAAPKPEKGAAPAADAPAADAAPAKAAKDDDADADKTESADAPAAAPAAPAAAAIETDVDDESWADFGGWYRQDYTIFYRPVGHKDKFIYSWLSLTGLQSPKGLTSPAAAVFDALTAKDAQGSCAKCHSVDDVPGKGRRVNFGPATAKTKEGRFTNFIHEPHLGILENRGCLTCHNLEKNRPYLKSYEQGNPQLFTSNFGNAKKELCQTCHTTNASRQDCLTCHKYHVNGVVTPIMSTKIPAQ
jgi:hypothetical protein